MLMKRCPRVDELKALASGAPVASRVARHVQTCETCGRILSTLKRDAALIDELRCAHHDDLDDRTRARLIERCAAAIQPEPPAPRLGPSR